MDSKSSALLLVLSAPSGAGKTTLAHRLIQEVPNAFFSVSFTTRTPRGAERDGQDYHFIDPQAFQKKIENGDFLEWAQVHDHFYGSPLSTLEEARQKDGVAVFDIDVQGGESVRRKYPDAVLVFILPPSLEELERRLRERGTDSDDTIQRRLLGARAEMERGASAYDYLIINDNFDAAVEKLKAVILAEKCRRSRVAFRL